MSVSVVGVGLPLTGNNVIGIPGGVVGVQDGDLYLCQVAIRSLAATCNTPSGWVRVSAAGNHCMYARIYRTGASENSPTITFTGGVAGDDTYARLMAVRGMTPEAVADLLTQQSNASAQNIAYPALPVTAANSLAIMALWKQDDSTSVTTPAGWTLDAVTQSTAGNDMLNGLYHQVQTTATPVTAGSVTVTGGVAAVSSAIMLTIKISAAITVTEQDAYPPRTLITMSSLTLGDDIAIYRVVAGQRTLVRGTTVDGVADTAVVRVDGELPFGVLVSYVGVVNGSAEYATGAVTYTLTGGKVALTDAVTGQAVEAVILAWEKLSYDKGASLFRVGGRNVVISGDLGQFTASISFYFEATSSADNFQELMAGATEGIFQIRGPGVLNGKVYDDVDCYVAVLSAEKARYSQDGSDPRRTWVVQVAENDAWAADLEAAGYSYQDMADYYGTAGHYYDVDIEFSSYLAVAQGDFS